jgi:hypothetical protein
MSQTPSLKPWREVIVPYKDVLDDKAEAAEFAADLSKVLARKAPPDYQSPERFFERTVITEGMSLLLQSVVRRLAGKGGDPVVQLQTAFGGGKTHTMMAVLHVARGEVSPRKMAGIPEILDKARVKELVKGRVAVLDGNALSPSEVRVHGKHKVKTLWGELAFQLGDEEGYALVAASDKDGTSPGKAVLGQLFESFGPAIVLMDEVVAYLRQFEKGKSYSGGTYNSVLSFLQALTEAATSVPNAMLLASLPESRLEVGDEHGQQVLETLQKLFGRVEAVWKPVAREEAYEIVRRRLFKPIVDAAARDAVCRAFADVYKENADKLPPETREARYEDRLRASYPIHPEVFDRLYEDWSSLPKFQRTRGVLRLMARLVHALWREDNRDLLILPGSIPLDELTVRNELLKYLPAGWDPIVDKDIDGAVAEPRRIDDEVKALGAIQACRRAARTIFLGSAASVAGQKVRGVGVERVRLGCVQPGQSIGRYDDALRRLTDRLHYLYSGNERYWFDLRTNLRREMEDRMQRFDPVLHIHPEIQERLRKLVKSALLPSVHVFLDAKDIPDKVGLRLVVLDPEQGHKRKETDSRAIKAAEATLARHGDKQREYQNRLLFLAPDASATQTLLGHVRRYLAWKSIVDDANELNLDKHHEKEATTALNESAGRVEGSLKETYRFLLAPMQDVEGNATSPTITWEEEPLSLAGSTYEKEISKTLEEKVWVIKAWAPIHLHDLLVKWFWKNDRPAALANKVWLDTCRYLYMPRLASSEVFVKTIEDGIKHKDWFAYSAGEKAPGVYQGLLFGVSGSVYLDDQALLVRSEEAEKAQPPLPARKSDAAPAPDEHDEVDVGVQPTNPGGKSPTKGSSGSALQTYKRFHGTVQVDPLDPISAFTEIVSNVIEQFTAVYGTQVTITIDVEARRKDKLDLKLVRVVKENAATLGFKTADFEED